jgi:hypothetical protein
LREHQSSLAGVQLLRENEAVYHEKACQCEFTDAKRNEQGQPSCPWGTVEWYFGKGAAIRSLNEPPAVRGRGWGQGVGHQGRWHSRDTGPHGEV